MDNYDGSIDEQIHLINKINVFVFRMIMADGLYLYYFFF